MRKLFCYITIVLILYISGSVFFVEIYYKYAVIVWMAYGFFLLITIKQLRLGLLKIKILTAIGVCESVVIIINRDFGIFTYLALFLIITGVVFLSETMSVEEYEEAYIEVITGLALISLVAFGLGILFPEYVFILPKTAAISQSDYYNAFIHVYNVSKQLGTLELRNNSIFWEGGCCQAFFSLGIMMNIKRLSFKKRSTYFSIIILSIAVMTTFSFTGYFILGLMLLLIFFELKIYNKILLCMAVLASIMMLFTNSYGLYFIARFGYYFNDISRLLERLGLDSASNMKSNFSLIHLLGISFAKYYSLYGGSNNSIMYYTFCLGGFFAIIMIYIYRKYVITYARKQRFIVAVIFIAMFSTESLMLKPTFLILGLLCLNVQCNCIYERQ